MKNSASQPQQQRGVITQAQSQVNILLQRVYLWMFYALVLSAATAYAISTVSHLIAAIESNFFVFMGILLLQIVVVVVLTRRIMSFTFQTAFAIFSFYAILTGVTLSVILSLYSPVLVLFQVVLCVSARRTAFCPTG